MKTFFATLFIFAVILFFSNKTPQLNMIKIKPTQNLQTAYFASGCFWCTEFIFENIKGVTSVVSGYAGGHTKNPTYESNNTGKTGHAEAISITYNPNIVSFSELVTIYFSSQNPTQINGQGNDIGSQYRSILFYKNETEKKIIQAKKNILAKQLNATIAAEVKKFDEFWIAENYHQNYVKLNPDNPYVKGVSVPRFNEFKKTCPLNLKKTEVIIK